MDKITETRINELHPKIREEVFALVNKANQALTGRAQVRIVQGYRSFQEQDALYAQGRTNKALPRVTNAKGGQSYHNYGLAIDFALLIDGKQISWDTKADWDQDKTSDWMEVVNIFLASGGWVWGKAFNDMPHLEKTFGLTYYQLLNRHTKQLFIKGTKYVQI